MNAQNTILDKYNLKRVLISVETIPNTYKNCTDIILFKTKY